MSLKSDIWIAQMVAKEQMIEEFVPQQVKVNIKGERALSYGLSSYGYDARCNNEFQMFSNVTPDVAGVVDPKNFNAQVTARNFISHVGDYCIIPPNSFVLTSTIEYFRMPRNVTGICLGKSTYARCGLVLNTTPIEAGWEGQITLEISNTGPLPVKIYAYEGIAQIMFFESDNCAISYADRDGKYQGQKGTTHAKV
jgi:dCTP deaminase